MEHHVAHLKLGANIVFYEIFARHYLHLIKGKALTTYTLVHLIPPPPKLPHM